MVYQIHTSRLTGKCQPSPSSFSLGCLSCVNDILERPSFLQDYFSLSIYHMLDTVPGILNRLASFLRVKVVGNYYFDPKIYKSQKWDLNSFHYITVDCSQKCSSRSRRRFQTCVFDEI